MEIDFEEDVVPILKQRCWHCHSEDQRESGLRLDLRNEMLHGGDSGLPAVVVGQPEKSYLIEVISHLDPDVKMPPDEEKLSLKEIDLLSQWIAQGAIWPGQMEEVTRQKSSHWSFQPIRRTEVPQGFTRSDNPIDAFLAKRLADQQLEFSQPSDARSLIRRASIVLTGLPPTAEEMANFLESYAVDAEGAYRRLIDRLIDSPHFGERWAQHWLDVIRWAETNGSESNMYRKNAWIYRDYVIRAFNEDKPYNRFVYEQIAGDTVGRGDATGYLVAGPHVPLATVGREPAARRQARADRMDEILQTVGASVLGVTIGCARCHNHKFDPISIRDYYSMSAVFEDIEFGSRFPELGEDHPRQIRGRQLNQQINLWRDKLRGSDPWEEDWVGFKEVHIPEITTRSVRFSFQTDSVRIDELEIFGAREVEENYALLSNGTKVDYPEQYTLPAFPITKINDGRFGNDAWAAKVPTEKPQEVSLELTFVEPKTINRIRLSSNREDFHETDYLEKLNTLKFHPYRIEVLSENGEWQFVAGTSHYEQLKRRNPGRVQVLSELQRLILQLNEEGPQQSFVARFISPSKTHILARGSPENPRDEVFAAGLSEIDGELALPKDAAGRTRRSAFADWVTRPGNPLIARVAVNRLWHHVFGRGIVATTSDFGTAGAKPTHPELLDWLASELMNPTSNLGSSNPKPWSMKHLICLMVTSDAFRQASRPSEKGLQVDANATFLWRFPPKRVEAEVIRDAILQASDCLDRTLGGRSYRIHNVKKRYAQWEVTDNHGSESWRRMIYQERMRRVDDQLFTAFDFPDCGQVRARRPISTTPLQALNLMNSAFVVDQSKRIAERAMKEADGNDALAVNRCFDLLLGRAPDEVELQSCLALLKENNLSLVCRALINSNEFAFLP